MVNQGVELIKDIIISILIILCIITVLAVIFYDKVSLSKVVPESEDYMLSPEMEEELKDTDIENIEEVIVNYYIDATDLKKYEKNNEYDKGRSNPFSYIYPSTTNGNTNSNLNNSSSNTNNNSGNFYEDDGTK